MHNLTDPETLPADLHQFMKYTSRCRSLFTGVDTSPPKRLETALSAQFHLSEQAWDCQDYAGGKKWPQNHSKQAKVLLFGAKYKVGRQKNILCGSITRLTVHHRQDIFSAATWTKETGCRPFCSRMNHRSPVSSKLSWSQARLPSDSPCFASA